MDKTSYITKETKKNKTDFSSRKFLKVSGRNKAISDAEKETYSLMEMWSYYLNFSRLEF
ncbi:MAG: hypothetical protein ABR597_12575 [Bacteroidales bacterium]